jgi:hypothetical protein
VIASSLHRGKMVLIAAIRDYVAKMLSELTGMKVLIVDKESVSTSISAIPVLIAPCNLPRLKNAVQMCWLMELSSRSLVLKLGFGRLQQRWRLVNM